MSLDLKPNWPWIVKFFEKSLPASRFYTFATTGPDGTPHTAPYGSLVLNPDCTGYYSDCFPNQLSHNLNKDPRICILAVRLDFWYWIKALISGRFEGWPGVRLYGTVDRRRKAGPGEIDRWRKKVKRYKCFKGYDLLWKDVDVVRDIQFTHFEPVRLGAMTQHLSEQSPHPPTHTADWDAAPGRR